MQGKIYEIPLDISSGVLTQQIREVVTEDMGTNTFKFKLVKDKHIPYALSGTVVRMMVKTPSGARIQQECTIENAESGTVSLTLKQSLILERGSHIAELQIFDAITQSIRLTTPTFDYHVRQSLQNSESIVATDEYTILQEALADLAGINIVVANKADKSDVGDIEDLTTTDKTNLVQAINEVKSQSNEIVTDVNQNKASILNKVDREKITKPLADATFTGWIRVAKLDLDSAQRYKYLFSLFQISASGSSFASCTLDIQSSQNIKSIKKINSLKGYQGVQKVRIVDPNATWTEGNYLDIYVVAAPSPPNVILEAINFTSAPISFLETFILNPEIPVGHRETIIELGEV